MKKIIVSMMLAGAMVLGGTAFAQTQGTTGATVQKENTAKGNKGNKGMNQKADRPKFNPFDGVQLTPDQQQRLQVLQQGLGPVQLTPEQQAKIKQNPDLTKEQKAQLKKERKAQKQQAKKDYLKGVKEILAPDQYVVFLENCYLYTPQDQGKAVKKSYKQKSQKGKKSDKSKKRNK